MFDQTSGHPISQLDWSPDVWSNIILGISVKVFLEEINI